MIVERLGKYHATLRPGLRWVWPIIESTRKINWRVMDVDHNSSRSKVKQYATEAIDLREHVMDFGEQVVITKDTVKITIDALCYFRITDARAAVFKVQNLPDAIELLTQATLRNIIAGMTLDDTFSGREEINGQLLSKVQRDSERWGVTITRVELFNISPPGEIARAMEFQIKAERERRSIVLQADGHRESEIIRSRGEAARMVLDAEGDRASQVKRAKGRAEARKLMANSEAGSLAAIRDAVAPFGVRGVDYLSAREYLTSLSQMTYGAPDSTVVLVPYEAMDNIENVKTLLTMNAAAGGRRH